MTDSIANDGTQDDLNRSRVAALYERNASEGFSRLLKKHYCFVKPSLKKYPFQWFWDTCFHVFVLCELDMHEVAQRNLRSLFLLQKDDGFVGHMLFWKRVLPTHTWDVLQAHPTFNQLRPHMSAVLQPSFIAQALERLHAAAPTPVFLEEMLPRIEAYLDNVWQTRQFDDTGLLSIISPVESGMDYKPSFDRPLGCGACGQGWRLYLRATLADLRNFLRGYDLEKIRTARTRFAVQETTFNVAFALDLLACARLQRIAGNEEDARATEERATRLQAAIFEHLYDPEREAFYDRCEGKHLSVLTVSTFFPLALPACPRDLAEHVLSRHFDDPKTFALPHPLPSVARNEPSYTEGESWFLWRGPLWMLSNWLTHQALCRLQDRKRAERLLASSLRILGQGAFREYYDPITGEGFGQKQFTWDGLALDMQRAHHAAFG